MKNVTDTRPWASASILYDSYLEMRFGGNIWEDGLLRLLYF